MFLIQKAQIGSSTAYLINAENEHNKFDMDFNSSRINDFLNEKKVSLGDFTAEIYSNYLEQENSHYQAKFFGKLAKEWNLGKYDKETFTDLMMNKFPKSATLPSGVKIKKNGNIIRSQDNASAGTDTVSSAPKSVSIEFARGNRETKDRIVRALSKTTEQLFEKLEKQVVPSCKYEKYQDFVPGSAKLLITTFTHYENRGYVDEKGVRRLEPNLHTHNQLKNYAEFSVYVKDENGNRMKDEQGNFLIEKKMLAIDPEQLFKRQLENSANFDTLLNSNLQLEGFKTEPADEIGQTFRLVGYTKEIESELSSRKNEIVKYLEEQKEKGVFYSSEEQAEIAYKNSVRKNTAISKELHNAEDILLNINETINEKISKEQLDKIDLAQSSSIQNKIGIDYEKIYNCKAFQTAGIVAETPIRAEIYKQVRFLKIFNSVDELEKCVDDAFLHLQTVAFKENRIIKMEDGRYTRLDIALNERALENNINILKSQKKNDNQELLKFGRKFIASFFKERKSKGFTMNKGQLSSLKLAIQQNPISMVIGDAGTGKTTSFIFGTNALHESLNRKVYGISVGTSTSRDLVDGNVKKENCLNTKEFINKAYVLDKDTKKPTNKINLEFLKDNLNSTIIFDEAGMCGSEDMRKITDFVKEARFLGGDTQLVLVGDNKQLASVSYGNAFTNIMNQLDSDTVFRLDENTRQRNEIAKSIAEGYRDKNAEKVFSTLENNDLLKVAKTEDLLSKKLVEDYINDKNKSKLIICGLNSEIDNINDLVRTELIKAEFLKPKEQQTLDFKKSVSIDVQRKSGNQTLDRKRSFCPGEEIVFLQNSNSKQKKAGFIVSNSDRGTIKKIKKLAKDNFLLTVVVKGTQFEFESKDYNNFNHSYAVSTHKSQGKTVDNVYHLGNANQATFQNSYVNGSRHKEQYKLYLLEDSVEKYKQKCTKEAIKETTLNDENCVIAVNSYVSSKIAESKKLEPMPDFLQKDYDKNAHLNNTVQFSKFLTDRSITQMNLDLENRVKEQQLEASKLLKRKEREIFFDKEFIDFKPSSNDNSDFNLCKASFFNKARNDFISGKEFSKKFFFKGLHEFLEKNLDRKVEGAISYIEVNRQNSSFINKQLITELIYKEFFNGKSPIDLENFRNLYARTNASFIALNLSYENNSLKQSRDETIDSAIQIIKNNPLIVCGNYLSETIRNNKRVAFEILSINPSFEKYLGKDLKNQISANKDLLSSIDYLQHEINKEQLKEKYLQKAPTVTTRGKVLKL